MESALARAERLLYFGVAGAMEAGLDRTMEDVLAVLRQASSPLGPIGEQWLKEQARKLRESGESTSSAGTAGA